MKPLAALVIKFSQGKKGGDFSSWFQLGNKNHSLEHLLAQCQPVIVLSGISSRVHVIEGREGGSWGKGGMAGWLLRVGVEGVG